METESKKRGFRLTYIIVIVIILIFIAFNFFPILSKPRNDPARHKCQRNLKQISLALIEYAQENDEKFPNKLSDLYPNYISERKVFRCPTDKLVTKKSNASIEEGIAFTKNQCSYGYDNTHTQADNPGVALVADRPATIVNDTNGSPNHGGKGQNVVYIDGHVEYVTSPLAGWYDKDGKRDNIYVDNSNEGTDTYIRHDGK